MIVTNLKYHLDDRLVKKLDLMIDRIEKPHPKKDIGVICEGAEGEGKTNSSLAVSYYVKYKTQRQIHLFFRLDSLVKFAQSTERQIIIYDEPALDALSTDWYKKTNQDLIRLLMVVRKKRHFIIFNFTKFHKFSEYIVVDRCIGLIHMYSRKEIHTGRFIYIPKRNLENLYRGYKVSKKRMYKKFGTMRGAFVEVLEKHLTAMDIVIEGKPHATLEDYEKLKDDSIMSVGNEEPKDSVKAKLMQEIRNLKGLIGRAPRAFETETERAKYFKTRLDSLSKWGKYEYIEVRKKNPFQIKPMFEEKGEKD